jgi:hypothetical protein
MSYLGHLQEWTDAEFWNLYAQEEASLERYRKNYRQARNAERMLTSLVVGAITLSLVMLEYTLLFPEGFWARLFMAGVWSASISLNTFVWIKQEPLGDFWQERIDRSVYFLEEMAHTMPSRTYVLSEGQWVRRTHGASTSL